MIVLAIVIVGWWFYPVWTGADHPVRGLAHAHVVLLLGVTPPQWHTRGMDLVAPAAEFLGSYRESLLRGWSSETATEDAAAAAAELAEIDADPGAFVAALNHPTRGGWPVTLPDGSEVPRLPGMRRWMWDGEYCGAISLRWQPGTMDLPPHCLGHIGYAVVPWKRRLGYATSALGQMLELAREEGLPFVDIVTDDDNTASQAVVRANGGLLEEEFVTPRLVREPSGPAVPGAAQPRLSAALLTPNPELPSSDGSRRPSDLRGLAGGRTGVGTRCRRARDASSRALLHVVWS